VDLVQTFPPLSVPINVSAYGELRIDLAFQSQILGINHFARLLPLLNCVSWAEPVHTADHRKDICFGSLVLFQSFKSGF
jgi:hypothetical protein